MGAGKLQQKLESGEFVVTAELGPPKSADVKVVDNKAKLLKGVVDAVNLTDNQAAVVRMSSIASAKIIGDLGLEPVIQMTTRDRNRIGIQSDLLGAAALGIKNLLCLTGDHQKFGNHPQSKNVFDLDSIQLISAVKSLNEGKFINGEEMEVPTDFYIGCAENPGAYPTDYRARRLAKKAKAGAKFCQTQAIYDLKLFEKWMDGVRKLGVDKKMHIIAGLVPLKSAGMAKYMSKNVPGISVPSELVERMEKADKCADEGIRITVEAIEKLRKIKGVSGVHIMAIEWEEAVPVIVNGAGLMPKK